MKKPVFYFGPKFADTFDPTVTGKNKTALSSNHKTYDIGRLKVY